MAMTGQSRLRERRQECGLTQTALARRAGVSRQLVAAVEAGHNAPAVDAALRLAHALATTVENLFADEPSAVVSALGGPLRDGVPLRLGRVADQLVAAELDDHGIAGARWANPDAVLEAGRLRVFPAAAPAAIVIAGCDPALGVAEAMLSGLGPRSLLAISASTGTAIAALERGGLHAAVVHGPPGRLPEPPVPVVRWHLARWRVGLGVSRQIQGGSIESVLRAERPVAQRDPAASSQRAFEQAIAQIGIAQAPQGPRAAGHIDAARLAATLTGVGVTTEGAARAFDLRFLSLEDHAVEIWLAERWLDHPASSALGELLRSTAFTDRVSQFGGYDLTGCGTTV
jgi:DNA-binding XRE family transcriptional regulator